MKFLFDWNGTIADDAARACFATNAALEALGVPGIDPACFDRTFMLPMDGMFLRLGVSREDLVSAASLWNAAMSSRTAPIRAGTGAYLRELRDAGEYCAVISAAGEDYLHGELAYFGLTDCFAEVLTGATDKVRALEGLRQDGQAMYFGDTEYDIASALTAGCTAVGVLSGYCPEDRLRAAGAQYVITDYNGLDGVTARRLFGSHVTN
ncbi:MAG TPA: HAD family hydrolase [Arthrobacter sp.]